MNTIQDLHLSKLRQEEAFGFHQLTIAELSKCTDAKFTEVLTTYREELSKFEEALKPILTNLLTQQITNCDTLRDNAYHGLTTQIRLMIFRAAAPKSEAAQKLDALIRKYGDPTTLPYIQENGILDNLLKDLEAEDMQEALNTINATDWVADLKQAHTQFVELFAQRTDKNAEVVTGASKQTRINTDNAYKACVTRINALAEINGYEAYAETINNVNKHIDYQKSVLAARTARNQSKELVS